MKNKKIQDLQIFLTRTPGEQAFKYEGLPSFAISGEAQQNFRNIPTEPYFGERSTNVTQATTYIAVANSSVVETIQFPFSPQHVLDMTRLLEFNEVRLIDCMEFGTQLFNCTIHGSIRDLFRILSNQSETLRLTIATSIPELAILPWEMMCDTKSDSYPKFLCFQPSIRFCRALHLFDRAKFKLKKALGDNQKIRILLVTSDPKNMHSLNFNKEEKLLKFVINESPTLDKSIQLEVIHNANTNILREKLLSFRPHILHLSCHGGYDKKENLGVIVLESPNNPREPDYVNSYRLTSIIQEPGSVQLAFISTCYGAKSDHLSSAFSGVAQLLHASGVNDVIALTFSVLDTTGHAILANFYKYLLRYGLTVEESISQVRKFLFINDYRLAESFGLTLYQGNASLYRKDTEQELTEEKAGREFDKTVQDIEASIASQDIFEMKVAEILGLDKIENDLKRLNLSNLETLLAVQVIGDIKTSVDILLEIKRLEIDIQVFLQITEIAKKLCLQTNERRSISTAFVLKKDYSEPDHYTANRHNIIKNLQNLFFQGTIKEIIQDASTVNGKDTAFMIILNIDKTFKSYIQKLEQIQIEEINHKKNLLNSKWNNICSLINKDPGVSLILPGNQRVKLIIQGEQISEFCNGEWKSSNFKNFREEIQRYSQDLNLDEDFMLDVLRKCICISDMGKGLIFIIQRENNLFDKCDLYDDRNEDLKNKKITEFESEPYLARTANLDGAIILSKDGFTLGIAAKLKPESDTIVQGIPGTGTRHLNTQKITKETDSIAFVVSEDGPITVFYQGEVKFRTP
ncbi:CHAT domain-containing protein [Tolypothrix sp. PCC 7910]|uniref:CHAT domain-containing protein n=1 Tax=Tolypothrix sp. PCC 7910 TaxID=2099387 RepID=UPI0014277A26|nr:CHAT domain-containing protein [Tolypothrix sp. PCC 7910]QIR36776.1 CHAT domain-containing protein [Tolypothrix sp. PCC 7910]